MDYSGLERGIEMKKIFYVIIMFTLVCLITGCGHYKKAVAEYVRHSEECINGVKYYQFPTGASVAYDKTGHVVTC